jgi:hypothetical protein
LSILIGSAKAKWDQLLARLAGQEDLDMRDQALPEAPPTIDPARARWEVFGLPHKKTAETSREAHETIAQRLARIRRERGMTQIASSSRDRASGPESIV